MGEDLSSAEVTARIEAALRRMPRVRREIFLAVRLDGMSSAEIARRTGLGEKQVRRQFARAIGEVTRAVVGPAQPARWRRWLRSVAGMVGR